MASPALNRLRRSILVALGLLSLLSFGHAHGTSGDAGTQDAMVATPPQAQPPPTYLLALYGDEAQFRLRVYTTGGMTAGGVRAVFPTDFSRFFRRYGSRWTTR